MTGFTRYIIIRGALFSCISNFAARFLYSKIRKVMPNDPRSLELALPILQNPLHIVYSQPSGPKINETVVIENINTEAEIQLKLL